MLRLAEKYKKEIVPEMMQLFGYKNRMAVPKVVKVMVNTGFGRLVSDKGADEQRKTVEAILQDLTTITGQRAVATKAKKAISSFKIREGMTIGAVVTLRGRKMYDFLERVINIALPRSRDFRGIDPNAFDRSGNLTIGMREHIIFPEISPEKIRTIFGLEITIATSAKNKKEGTELIRLLGFPIKH
jgi:large subunit ribosomal protein L5